MRGDLVRSATLAEYKAEARALAERLDAHEHVGTPMPRCRCEEATAMRKELRERRKAIATWFDPPADAETLL